MQRRIPTLSTLSIISARQVMTFLIGAAIFPELLPDAQLAGQRAAGLAVSRAATVLFTVYIVCTARFGISAARMLPFVPSAAGSESPAHFALGFMAGTERLKLSSWIRMCCAFHTFIFELNMLPILLTGLQITGGMRRRFPPWKVARGLCLAYGLNDLLLFGCTCIYLRLLAGASGHHPDVEGRSDMADVGLLYLAMRVHAPVQLLLAITLTPENRLRVAGALRLARISEPHAAGHGGRSTGHARINGPCPLCEKNSSTGHVGPCQEEQRDDKAMADEDRECSVCMEREATHILAPCGHRCVCAACSALVTDCPMCRAHIQSTVCKVW